MELFDVLVIGSGSGMIVASNAVANGLKVALVESGPMGGTCLNRGCIPSKMLIYPADVVATIQEAKKIGVNALVDSVDFNKIMSRMKEFVSGDSGRQAASVEKDPDITWYKDNGEFVSDYTMKVGEHIIKAERIFIVSGARPLIPPIKGLQKVDYVTNETLLDLEMQPKSMVIIGGGYIGVEYAHFFSSIGTKITVIQRAPMLIPEEEPEISQLLREEMQKNMEILVNYEVIEIERQGNLKKVTARRPDTGDIKEFFAETLLVAAGRIPNSDTVKPQKTGVELDTRGYIRSNEYLETTKKNIWAFGDAIGKQMFKHVANYEAQIAWHNAVHDHKATMDYMAAPHAVFTHPQVASVGLTEDEARKQGYKIAVGKAYHKDTAKGAAMGEPPGFVKVIIEQKTDKILGGHIIGPYAPTLIQEIVNAMVCGDQTYTPILRAMHIHPAMTEVVQNAFGNIERQEEDTEAPAQTDS